MFWYQFGHKNNISLVCRPFPALKSFEFFAKNGFRSWDRPTSPYAIFTLIQSGFPLNWQEIEKLAPQKGGRLYVSSTVVIWQSQGRAYMLAELDRSIIIADNIKNRYLRDYVY